jgi:2-keto-4-pentenoate hydratase/2-oxohepta-3-ene-1,7-dioic acid hydratase in catechol pathway
LTAVAGSEAFRLGHFASPEGTPEVFAEVDGVRYKLGKTLESGTTVDTLIASWNRSEELVRDAILNAVGAGAELPDGTALLPPVVRPSKILLIGTNYRDHCEEVGARIPTEPGHLMGKPPTALSGSGGEIRWDPADTQQVDLEAELCIVMGRTAKRVSRDSALDYVFGYTAGNDVSARDLQTKDRQWFRGKGLDTFCPLGPVVVRDPSLRPERLNITSSINGEVMQSSNTSNMIFGVAEIVAFISRFVQLEPGDVLLTGTPAGVGFSREPQVFLANGDRVEVTIEGIGTLVSNCRTYE